MNRILLAFRCFFNILFHGELSAETLGDLKLSRRDAAAARPAPSPGSKVGAAPATPPAPSVRTSDGALQLLGILQRDSRLVDFLMEDIASYSDDQVGAAVRELHDQCRDAVTRYVTLQPVIDGVEGTFTKTEGVDKAALKFIGKVPPSGTAPGGVLRHKGWKAEKVDLPPTGPNDVLAPAEIEIE